MSCVPMTSKTERVVWFSCEGPHFPKQRKQNMTKGKRLQSWDLLEGFKCSIINLVSHAQYFPQNSYKIGGEHPQLT